MDPYMTKAEALLRDAKAMLEALRQRAQNASAGTRVEAARKVKELEARFAEASRKFEQLRGATQGTADLKVALEKAMDAFRSEMSGK